MPTICFDSVQKGRRLPPDCFNGMTPWKRINALKQLREKQAPKPGRFMKHPDPGHPLARDSGSADRSASDPHHALRERQFAQKMRTRSAPGPVRALPFQRAAAISRSASAVVREKAIVQSPNSRCSIAWFISSLIW